MQLQPLEDSLFLPQDERVRNALLQSGVVNVADAMLPLWEIPKNINVVILIGGRGGLKTYGASQFIAYQAANNKKRCVILRDERSKIKSSILNEILQRYDSIPYDTGTLKLDSGLKDSDGKEIVFTQGFKASSNEKKANLKGVSDIDIAVVEEAEDIRDEEKFNTFHDSIRKKGSLVIIILNTPDINHWVIKRYFNCLPAKKEDGTILEGYFKVEPKSIPGFFCIQTSFKDNPYLPSHIVDRYNARGNPESHLYDPHYFYTAIKGLSSTGRKGQILTKVKPIKLSEYMKLPLKEVYGQDFGTSSPAALIGVKFDKNNCYARQINYLPMGVLSIGKLYSRLGFGDRDKIIGDKAEPKTIDRLKKGWKRDELPVDVFDEYPNLRNGFFIISSIGGPGSIKTGISLMTGMNLFAVEESIDLWNEIYNWVYAVDKNMQPTDDPIDDFNHLCDAWRNVIHEHKGKIKTLQSGYFR